MPRLAVAAALVAIVAVATPAAAVPEGPSYPSAEWSQREATNYAKTGEEPARQAGDGAFQARLLAQSQANEAALQARDLADPSWASHGNLCESWMFQCAGDPFLYPGVDPFYDKEGTVTPVVFYDRGCARISGRVWAPKASAPGDRRPAVVIETGSVQAPETLYWWFAQQLVRAGYVTMTYDVRGQGRSDNHTPSGEQGSNNNPAVFWDGLVDAIDFFRSSPAVPYPHDKTCAGTFPTRTVAANPFWDRIDPDRFGIVGHSLGATGVSRVQGMDPWPGKLDRVNPVDVVVAWDNLTASDTKPRVPSMGLSNDYGLTPTPFAAPPDPEGKKVAFTAWSRAGVPTYQLVIQGGTHYEYSRIPTFPTTSWTEWGNPLAGHYTLAWLDRWLKRAGEVGYADADARLLADRDWTPRMSFYSRSARNFPDRAGAAHVCADIRAGCADVAPAAAAPGPAAAPGGRLPATGGHEGDRRLGALALAVLALITALRRWRGGSVRP